MHVTTPTPTHRAHTAEVFTFCCLVLHRFAGSIRSVNRGTTLGMDAENTTKPSRAYAAGKKFSLGTQGPSPRMRSEYAGVDTSAAAATLSSGDAVASYMNGGGLKAASGAGSGAPGGGNVNDGGDRALRATASDNVHVIHGAGGRLVCVSDIRGQMQRLNEIALETRASAIVHTGDFGFYTQDSIERMGDRTLRHVVQYSPLLSSKLRQVLLESSDARDTHQIGRAHV